MAYIAGDPQLTAARQLVEGAASAGQASIAVPGGFTPGMVDVAVGGAVLSKGDYDDTDGMTIKLAQPMSLNTQFRVVAWAQGMTAQPVGGQMAGYRNKIVNGGCRVAQRPAVALTQGQIGLGGPDRWKSNNGGAAGGQFTQLQGSLGYNGIPNKCLGITVQTPIADLSSNSYWTGFQQLIEGYSCFDLYNGQPVTLSFIFWSQVAGIFSASLRSAGGTYSCVKTFTVPAAIATQIVLTFPALPFAPACDNTAQILLNIAAMNNGIFNTSTLNSWVAGNYLAASGSTNWATSASSQILGTNFQLESGSVATPFEQRPYATDLLMCQRFAELIGSGSGRVDVCNGFYNSTTLFEGMLKWAVKKRISPAVSLFGSSTPAQFRTLIAGGALSATAVNFGDIDLDGMFVTATIAGGVAGQGGVLQSQDGTTPQILIDAEL